MPFSLFPGLSARLTIAAFFAAALFISLITAGVVPVGER